MNARSERNETIVKENGVHISDLLYGTKSSLEVNVIHGRQFNNDET